MALKLPAIPEIEDAAELLSLVANSKLYTERMSALFDIYGKIKTELDAYIKVRTLEEREGDARETTAKAGALMTAAREADEVAQKIVAESRKSADEFTAQAQKEIGAIRADLSERQRVIDEAEKELDDRRNSLEKTENHLKTQYAELDEQRKIVTQMHHNAVAMKIEYEEKLSKLKALI